MPGPRPLSKSQYQKGRQCLRRIWLYRNRPELADAPSLVQAGIFEQGHEVGRLAQNLFTGGTLIAQDQSDPDGALADTQAALRAGATALFEAAFLHDGILVRADVVAKNPDGSWSLFEVKSTTSVKKEHLSDVAIQTHVIRNSGLALTRSHLVHLDNQYVRRGELDLGRLFVIAQVDDRLAEALAEIPARLAAIRSALASGQQPSQAIGSVCKSPYPCEFQSHCWSDVRDDSIHYLHRITDKKRAERDQAPVFDRIEIGKHLEKLVWPLWFLDFETIGYAIPAHDGTRPYQALPFQFSLHAQKEPDAPLEHVEFLHPRSDNPCRPLAQALCAAVGDKGSVVAYHASFESGRIRELGQACPELAPGLESIAARMWDLELPFARRHYCHPKFQGSSSIKKVLPVLVPELSYDGLEIAQGDLAQLRYGQMIALPDADPEKDRIRQGLLRYCGLDSLAMAKLLEALRRL